MESLESKEQPPRLPKPVRIDEQVWPEATVPVVSVFSWAYNHAAFIRESIESILMQETTFPVEIIIHDDASNDGTTEIIREYEAKYPQLFRNIIQTENQWSQGKNVMDPMFTAPQGEFVALTHGDDYWTSSHKLQKQADYLRSEPTASGCFHGAVTIDERGATIDDYFAESGKYASRYSQRECVGLMSAYHTASLVYRRDACPPHLARQTASVASDYVMDLLITEQGSLDYLDFSGSAYRTHGGGVWQGVAERRRHLEQVRRLAVLWRDKHFGPKYGAEFQWLGKMFFQRYQESLVKSEKSLTQRLRIYSNDLRGVPFTWWSKLAFRFEGGLVKRRLRKADVAA